MRPILSTHYFRTGTLEATNVVDDFAVDVEKVYPDYVNSQQSDGYMEDHRELTFYLYADRRVTPEHDWSLMRVDTHTKGAELWLMMNPPKLKALRRGAPLPYWMHYYQSKNLSRTLRSVSLTDQDILRALEQAQHLPTRENVLLVKKHLKSLTPEYLLSTIIESEL